MIKSSPQVNARLSWEKSIKEKAMGHDEKTSEDEKIPKENV